MKLKSLDTIISEINLTENGYSLSEIRDSGLMLY